MFYIKMVKTLNEVTIYLQLTKVYAKTETLNICHIYAHCIISKEQLQKLKNKLKFQKGNQFNRIQIFSILPKSIILPTTLHLNINLEDRSNILFKKNFIIITYFFYTLMFFV